MNAHEQRWQIEINENISNVDFLDQLLKITFLLNSMAFLLSWSFQLHFSFSVFFLGIYIFHVLTQENECVSQAPTCALLSLSPSLFVSSPHKIRDRCSERLEEATGPLEKYKAISRPAGSSALPLTITMHLTKILGPDPLPFQLIAPPVSGRISQKSDPKKIVLVLPY